MTDVERAAAEFLVFFQANTPTSEEDDDDFPLSLTAFDEETSEEVVRLLKNLEFSLAYSGFIHSTPVKLSEDVKTKPFKLSSN